MAAYYDDPSGPHGGRQVPAYGQPPLQAPPGTPSFGGGYQGGYSGYPQPGFTPQTGPSPFFDDPLTQPIMSSWTQRMSQLSQPGPNYGESMNVYRSALKEDPRYTDALKSLSDSIKRKAPPNAYLGQYARSTQQRMGELNADPFSSSDEAALKARFFDDLARSRDDRQQQLRERLAGMGMAPTSGTAQEASTLLEGEYEGARAAQQRDLLKYVTDERNRRRDLAVQMSGGLSQQGAVEASNQAQYEGQRANIASALAGLLANLQNQRLGVAQGLAGLQRQAYVDDIERGGQHLETSALPAAIGQQRLAQMQQWLSGQGTPQSSIEAYQAQQRIEDERKRYADANKGAFWGNVVNAVGTGVGGYFNAQAQANG
jgi:hypothetical protein